MIAFKNRYLIKIGVQGDPSPLGAKKWPKIKKKNDPLLCSNQLSILGSIWIVISLLALFFINSRQLKFEFEYKITHDVTNIMLDSALIICTYI